MNVANIHSSGHLPVSQIATHIVCILSSTVSPPALNSFAGSRDLIKPVALRLAIWCMARATSEWTGGGSCSQYFCSFLSPLHHGRSLHSTLSTWGLCSFSQIFASRLLDTWQSWLELLSHWFHYLKELPGISFWVCCFQFHAHAFQLLLFIHSVPQTSVLDIGSYLCLLFCFHLFPDWCKSLIRYLFLFFLFATCRIQSFLWLLPAGLFWYLSRDLIFLPCLVVR